MCALTAGIKKYKSNIKKKREKHDKFVLLAQSKLNTLNVLIFEALIDSYIGHNKCFNKYCVKEYNEMKGEIKNRENAVEYTT